MTMTLRNYMDANGLTDEQTAEQLSALLGKPIKPAGVRLWSLRQPPKAWAEALSLPDDPEFDPLTDPTVDEPEADAATPGRAGDSPPRPPLGTRVLIPAGDLARARIAQTYGLVGAGLSMATGNKGYSAVVDDCAPAIASAWLKAAEENDFCRRVVALMSTGGATGELVITHILMLSGLLYVAGQFPVALNAKWSGYAPRPVVAPGVNGAANAGAGDTVAEPGRASDG